MMMPLLSINIEQQLKHLQEISTFLGTFLAATNEASSSSYNYCYVSTDPRWEEVVEDTYL